MQLFGKTKIEDCKKAHARLRNKLDAFVSIVEGGRWKTPLDLEGTLGRTDKVGDYYVFEVGGKKGARVSVVIVFVKQTVLIHEIFTDHDKYMKWSQQVLKQAAASRKARSKKRES